MDMCELLCGEESYWTREDLDEFGSEVTDLMSGKGVEVTKVYLKKVGKGDVFDIEFRCNGELSWDGTLGKEIRIDTRRAKVLDELISVYASEVAKAILEQVELEETN